ncbi:MAG: serine/threonine-protein kinase [Acidobacteria bacterium]|nr:MAG: serine/threonine-protein kinase [Acidobacteriota bacterium]
MSLSPGTRIGPYEVVAPIGAGGMGEVFRARDTRLKRDVALKVLPAAALGDPDRRARFEREAQVLASLNHTSIAQVFGVEADGDAQVIVMELVEGATLADRMAKGALAIDDALAIATQICDGLEAAHERGIVHRDLKPANIKVRPDGSIKILDFGIARVLTDETPVDPGNSPTVMSPKTDSGLILGTAAYMSPEQARGRGVDKRADIWAFGCVVYEMLTGARVFPGESVADILAAIISKEPDWSRLPPALSPRVTELLRRCLQKNPKDRLRDAADARYELIHAGAAQQTNAGRPSRAAEAHWIRGASWFAAGAALTAAVLVFTPLGGRGASPSTVPVRSVIQLPQGTSLALSRGSVVAVSPDGRSLVFAGRRDGVVMLHLRTLDTYETRALAGTEEAANPFFSPDGRWVGFFAKGKLKKVSLDGGAPVAIDDVPNARGETWANDGTIYVTPTNAATVEAVAKSGGPRAVVTAKTTGQLSHRWPFAMPDGAGLLYTIWNDLGWEPAEIVAQKMGNQRQQPVVAAGGYPHYLRDAGGEGFLVYARSEGLMAARFNESSLSIVGQPVPLGDSVVTNLSGGAHFDLSASGTLAYVPGVIGEADRTLAWVDLAGRSTPAITIHGLSRVWTLSPEGARIVRNNTVGATRDIWIDSLLLGTSARLDSTSAGFSGGAVWLPDGESIVFARDVPNSNLFLRKLGTNVDERLTTGASQQLPTSVSPDGTSVAFSTFDPSTGSDIWILSLADRTTRPFVKTTFIEGSAVFSPDGKWIAYQTNDSGRFEVFVRPFPSGEPAFRVSRDGGIAPQWSASGREVLYRTATDSKLVAVPVMSGATFSTGTARVLFDATGFEAPFAVAPDGKRLLMMTLIPTEQLATQINLVQNFITELRARVK